MTDHFASIDGKEHGVDARYYMEMHSGMEEEEPGGLYQFPTQGAFAKTAKGDKETLPAGGLILYKTSPTTPDAGDGVNPQAAIAYDLAPSTPAEFAFGTNEKGNRIQERLRNPLHAQRAGGWLVEHVADGVRAGVRALRSARAWPKARSRPTTRASRSPRPRTARRSSRRTRR